MLTKQNEIPESTFYAFEKLHENGHLVFVNTGRSRAYVQDEKLLSLGFFDPSLFAIDQGGVHTVCVNHKEQLSLIVTCQRYHNV